MPKPGAFFSKACALLGAGLAISTTAAAQGAPELTFSIDLSGPTINLPGDPIGTRITDGDLLVRSGGPFDPTTPRISVRAQFLDSYNNCQAHLPGVACGLEVNAISFGADARLRLNPSYQFNVLFSVDEWAVGRQGAAGTSTNVFNEAMAREASTDMYFARLMGAGPFASQENSAYADGNGERVPNGGPHVFGLGLTEPTLPNASTVETGDNVDAINYGAAFDPADGRLFFSLEGDADRCNNETGASFNAAGNQQLINSPVPASSGDVLFWTPGAPGVALYASALQLGLDQLGASSDDIDALMVVENGDMFYTPPVNLYDWNSTTGTDLILFSVRCNSNIVGRIDPVSGREIGEGDILIKLNNGSILPQVFIPAEALGLRSIAAGDGFNDELNGLDIFDDDEDPFLDCNDNGIDDALDISDMNSDDIDNNGIPDECEDDWSSYCDCALASDSPCGNNSSAGRGCLNTSGLGARLTGGGTTSVDSDSLLLLGSDFNPTMSFGLVYAGLTAVNVPFQHGIRCLASSGPRMGPFPIVSGNMVAGPGLIGAHPATLSVVSGSTMLFQAFYRDIPGPCPGATIDINMSNGLRVLFTP